jgi:hypothetical protein
MFKGKYRWSGHGPPVWRLIYLTSRMSSIVKPKIVMIGTLGHGAVCVLSLRQVWSWLSTLSILEH